MTLSIVAGMTLSHGQDVVTKSVTISTDGKAYAELTVTAGATVTYTGIAGTQAALKAYEILPTFGGTANFNYASGLDDLITLVANEPLFWHEKLQLAKHMTNTNTIVSIDFHNTDAADGTVKILIGRDDTP